MLLFISLSFPFLCATLHQRRPPVCSINPFSSASQQKESSSIATISSAASNPTIIIICSGSFLGTVAIIGESKQLTGGVRQPETVGPGVGVEVGQI